MIISRFFIVSMLMINVFSFLTAQEQVRAFPGAEGFGAYATGGRGGDVYIVTNLNDAGPGSLREAVEATGPRTIVFAVSGTIELQEMLRISNGDLTIAGQTAPGDGICLKNYNLKFSADNIIVRYISLRLGIDKRWEDDAVNGSGDNIIMDHCSVSWGVDETLSLYSSSNLTVQWCIISECLTFTTNSYGGIWGGQPASFHHNLFAHNASRTPRLCGSRYHGDAEVELVDHRNNVIYNWNNNSCYGGEGGSFNLVNNYYKPGPATQSHVNSRIVAPRADDGSGGGQEAGIWGEFYVSGNFVDGHPEVTADNSLGIHEVPAEMWDQVVSDVPFTVEEINMQTPQEAYMDVLNHVGASLPKRDRVDARITEETRTGTAHYGSSTNSGIIKQPDDVGGYPSLESTAPPLDTDQDGIPDEWEDANGLDKNDPEDGKIIQADGYSNLEHYLNSLVGDFRYMLRPMEVAATVDDQTVSLTWTDLSDKEDGFILQRADGEGDFTEIADLEKDTENYTDNTINEYGMYTYRLKAYNADMETSFTDGLEVDVANPNPPRYTVTVDVEGSGSVIMNPDQTDYLTGTEVSLLATADSEWEFDGWSGDITGEENPVTLLVDADKNVTATFNSLIGVEEQIYSEETVRIYPNPVRDKAVISFILEEPDEVVINLYNIQGKVVRQIAEGTYPSEENRLEFDGSSVRPGVYFLHIRTEGEVTRSLMIVS